MPDKPITAAGYRREHVERFRATCLCLATKLADLLDDVVVIGGLVPSLLIAQDELPVGGEAHVGTMDLDIGLTRVVLDDGRYRALTERRRALDAERTSTSRETQLANVPRHLVAKIDALHESNYECGRPGEHNGAIGGPQGSHEPPRVADKDVFIAERGKRHRREVERRLLRPESADLQVG